MSAYYNENDPKAAAWLRELIKEGCIAAGDVDERSILDVRPHEIAGYTQQHFFAGIGGWSLALRLADWPDSRPVRTGSCPCQPFSAAGKGLGEKDERHLWPVFRDLITFGEPTITFGEQVASKAGRDCLAGVRADLEGLGYEVGAADLCAAGVGAPHIRQRLWWLAYANGGQCRDGNLQCGGQHRQQPQDDRFADWLEHSTSNGRQQRRPEPIRRSVACGCGSSGTGNANEPGSQGRRLDAGEHANQWAAWAASELIPCRDGKARRIESGTFPLAHGIPNRVGLLRGYGNAIVPQVAAAFIQASREAICLTRARFED